MMSLQPVSQRICITRQGTKEPPDGWPSRRLFLICEVVEEGPTRKSWKDPTVKIPIKHRCQFSWFCDGKSDNPKDKTTYEKFLSISDTILSNDMPFYDITGGATHYHADYVTPAWAKTKTKTIEIQDHIFYRWN